MTPDTHGSAMSIVVVSPHLDDAVLSLGATMHRLVADGSAVTAVTVFAGDPDRDGAPSAWDVPRGLATAAEVVAARRAEDATALGSLGVRPVWLPFDDDAHLVARDPDAIWHDLEPVLAEAQLVLLPGWPLVHGDHRYTTRLVLARIDRRIPAMFYGEMPYAWKPVSAARALLRGRSNGEIVHALGEDLTWYAVRVNAADLNAKYDALARYVGELPALGFDGRPSGVLSLGLRREMLAHPASAHAPQALARR